MVSGGVVLECGIGIRQCGIRVWYWYQAVWSKAWCAKWHHMVGIVIVTTVTESLWNGHFKR